MEGLMLLVLLFAILLGLVGFVWGIIFFVKDAPQKNQSVALWVVLYILFGLTGLGLPVLGIYLLVTNRVGWGLFWLIGAPIILFTIFFVLGFFGALVDSSVMYLLAPLF